MACDVHKPGLSTGGTVKGHQDLLISPGNLAPGPTWAGRAKLQARNSEMPGSSEPWPQVPQVSVQATDQPAPRVCRRGKAICFRRTETRMSPQETS